MSASLSPRRPPPTAACTSPPHEGATTTASRSSPTPPTRARPAIVLLEGVLAHDRADLPAVTQRRHLAQTDGPHAAPRRAELLPPTGFQPGAADRRPTPAAHRRPGRPPDPASGQAPGGLPISNRPRRRPSRMGALRPTDRRSPTRAATPCSVPPCGSANHEARTAGARPPPQCPARCRRRHQAVKEAEAAIASIHAEGAPEKEHLDRLRRPRRRAAVP